MQSVSKVLCRVLAISKTGKIWNTSLIWNSYVRHHSEDLCASVKSASGVSRRLSGREESKSSPEVAFEARKLPKFLLEQGLSHAECEKFVKGIPPKSAGAFVDEDIITLIRFLNTKDIGINDVMTLREKVPCLLKRNFPISLEQKLSILENIGVDRKDLRSFVLRNPQCLGGNVEDFMARIDFLRTIPLVDADVYRVITKFPAVLRLSVENNLQPKLEIFSSLGMRSHKLMRRLFVGSPRILGRTREKIFQLLDVLQELGFERGTTVFPRAFAIISSKNHGTVKATFKHLLSLGFTKEQVKRMIVGHPSLLTTSTEAMSKKVAYLVEVMKRSICDIVNCPAYLSYSFDRRIRPRHEAFVKWKAENRESKEYAVSSLLQMSGKKFCTRFHGFNCKCCL